MCFSIIPQTQFDEIEKTRNTIEHQKELEREAIDNKLKAAASIRDENIKKMQERLKEHVTHSLKTKFLLQNFLTNVLYGFQFLSQNIVKLTEVKIMVDEREQEKSMEKRHVFENKLFLAELKREKELQKKLETIRKHVSHISHA